MHLGIPLAFLVATRAHGWLMVNLSSTSTPRSLSTELLSSKSAPSLYWCMGLLLPRCRTLHLPLLNFIRFLCAQLSSLSRSRWMTAQPETFQSLPHGGKKGKVCFKHLTAVGFQMLTSAWLWMRLLASSEMLWPGCEEAVLGCVWCGAEVDEYMLGSSAKAKGPPTESCTWSRRFWSERYLRDVLRHAWEVPDLLSLGRAPGSPAPTDNCTPVRCPLSPSARLSALGLGTQHDPVGLLAHCPRRLSTTHTTSSQAVLWAPLYMLFAIHFPGTYFTLILSNPGC